MNGKIEKIGGVTLNLELYRGTDEYSDGDIEDELLEKVRQGISGDEMISEDSRWPVLYHFSPIRGNLLDWVPFSPGARVLEIGAGCGAVTGVLCDRCGEVTSLDLSRRRSLINAYRHRDLDNLEIVVANFEDYEPAEPFDYITLIGVLEYAMSYMKGGESAFVNLLRRVGGMLRPGGTLIVAIENKLGLKYWNGAGEDHTGRPFEGIEDYPETPGVRTFSKQELSGCLADAGYTKLEFYYPCPDYKMPAQVFSDHRLPQAGEIFQKPYNYDFDQQSVFNENYAWDSVIKAGRFGEFANSFLVFATRPFGEVAP